MTLDDIKGRTYTSSEEFWRDLGRVVADAILAERDRCLDIIEEHEGLDVYWLDEIEEP